MLNEIISIYATADDRIKAIGPCEDMRRQMSDAEIITTALVAAAFFGSDKQLEHFVELVVPELQRRGLFRKEYTGSTLREHLGLKIPS